MDAIAGPADRRLVEALDRHTDPVVRELGRQLAGGTAPHELLAVPRFARMVERGMQRLDEFDEDRSTTARLITPMPIDPRPDDGGVPAGRR